MLSCQLIGGTHKRCDKPLCCFKENSNWSKIVFSLAMNSFGGLGSAVNMCVKIGSSNVLIMRIFPFNDRLRLFQLAMIVFILANLFSKFSVTDWASTLEKVMPSTFSLFVHLIFNSGQIGSLVSASLPAQNACVFSMFGFKPEYLAYVPKSSNNAPLLKQTAYVWSLLILNLSTVSPLYYPFWNGKAVNARSPFLIIYTYC